MLRISVVIECGEWSECSYPHHKHDPTRHTVTASVTKIVSERPLGPVRLVIVDIRGVSRPLVGVGRELGSASQARSHGTRP